ncbi:hypothetical protein SAMN05444266_105158 [Chitinophaga jiangningensis]|uniref:Uncharacterized protein n=1 Tax=Chitinophaga jiangningensis TaxID=1419482 RepID=A0A1M7DVH7_9BACT|nr:hypothetical protein [Chitinophaga jiangningensis]SHL83504.1 hypothetical protein SAMN05444266_105158 [Chitinophaga jiangningensis]
MYDDNTSFGSFIWYFITQWLGRNPLLLLMISIPALVLFCMMKAEQRSSKN